MWQNKKMYPLPDHSLLFRSSPYPYLVMAIDLTIIDANDACLRSVQRTREEIVGLHVFEASPPNPSDPDSTNIREVKASLFGNGDCHAQAAHYAVSALFGTR